MPLVCLLLWVVDISVGFVNYGKNRYTELSEKLDQIISFADDDDRRFPAKTVVGAGAGTAGVGAAGYGLYRRGLNVPGYKGRSILGADVPPARRGVIGNITEGAAALPGDVRGLVRRAGVTGSILAHPEARAAGVHDIRTLVGSRLAKLAKKIHP